MGNNISQDVQGYFVRKTVCSDPFWDYVACVFRNKTKIHVKVPNIARSTHDSIHDGARLYANRMVMVEYSEIVCSPGELFGYALKIPLPWHSM